VFVVGSAARVAFVGARWRHEPGYMHGAPATIATVAQLRIPATNLLQYHCSTPSCIMTALVIYHDGAFLALYRRI
jgi:hypothetical protein